MFHILQDIMGAKLKVHVLDPLTLVFERSTTFNASNAYISRNMRRLPTMLHTKY